MKVFTLGKNHSVVPSVTTNAQQQAILGDMKGSTLVINRSAAPSVATNALEQAI